MPAHRDYRDCAERIAKAYEHVREKVAELHDEQQRAVDILREKLPDPPELPEAAPQATAPVPQFDSEWDFVTASRRLIVDKKLISTEEDDGSEEARS